MSRKKTWRGTTGILLLAGLGFAVGYSISSAWMKQKLGGADAVNALAAPGSDRERDGLKGPVNRVRTEIAKLSLVSGKLVESSRQLLELSSYDSQGRRIENAYYLVPTNAQVGAEEYAYDDKGNMSEMTLRGMGHEMLRKDVYTYEYDTVGNWTKMVTHTLLYEGGKVTPKPVEVTHRAISYFYDQSIADIVQAETPESVRAEAKRSTEEDFAALRLALDGWLAATNARDVERLMSFYGSKMDSFYRARNVAADVVRSDRTRMFERADSITVRTGAPEITLSSNGRAATMLFTKDYVMKVNGRERRGKVLQQLRWQLTGEGWKIVGERDVRLLKS